MDIVAVLIVVLVAVVLSAFATAEFVRRRSGGGGSLQDAVDVAMAKMQQQASADRDSIVSAAAINQRELLAAAAAAALAQTVQESKINKEILNTRLDGIEQQFQAALGTFGLSVGALSEASTLKFGQIETLLKSHAETTALLSDTTGALAGAMANSAIRGQWGERMAEDVLIAAGFVANINYTKQAQVDGPGKGRPDFTFPLPQEQVLYMDVKFPLDAYLRYHNADNEAVRTKEKGDFLTAVRGHVTALAKRDYTGESTRESVDYVLMFLPNEQLAGFIYENDPSLIDDALKNRVVMCSPLTLFAFLAVIRQAFDSFNIERASGEMLRLLAEFNKQWKLFNKKLDEVKRRNDLNDKDFDLLLGVRTTKLEVPLKELEALRREHGILVEGEVLGDLDALVDGSDDDEIIDVEVEDTVDESGD